MDDPLVVRVLERVAYLWHDGQRLARRNPLDFEQMPQAHPIHKLHQKVEQTIGLPKLIQGDNAGMIQLGQRLGFAEKDGVFPIPGGRILRATMRSNAFCLAL